MNTIMEKLVLELDKPMNGDPWYGSSLKSILESVSAKEAFTKVSADVHSIAEIVLHIHAWIYEVNSRLEGNEPKDPSMGDWPPVLLNDEDYWGSIKKNVYDEHERMISLVNKFPFEKLEEVVGKERFPQLGTGISYREMLVGLMQHNIYHIGQVALIRKFI